MTGMVEKVAKAIAKAAVEQNPMLQYFDDNGVGYFDDYDNKNYDCIAIARAAIEAMMEPDDLMKLAGGFKAEAMMFEGDEDGTGVIFNDMGHVYRAMIQAALKEGQ